MFVCFKNQALEETQVKGKGSVVTAVSPGSYPTDHLLSQQGHRVLELGSRTSERKEEQSGV